MRAEGDERVGIVEALHLDSAWRLRDPGLLNLNTDPLMDPLRQEKRFQEMERELKIPR